MFTLKRLILVLQLRITNLLRTPSPCLTTQNLRQLTSTFSHLIHHHLHAISVYVTQSYTSSQLHNIRASMSISLLQRLNKMQGLTKLNRPKERQESNHKGYDDSQNEQITFASDTPNSNHNEFKNNTNDFPKLDNFLNAQLYSVSKNKEKCLSQNYNIFQVLNVRLLKHILNCQVRDSINN